MEVRLPEIIEITLYRALIELISNSVKYPEASNILIKIYYLDRKVNISLSDNGKGFIFELYKNKEEGYGLRNIESRIEKLDGYYSYKTAPGEGVKVDICLNLD